MIYYLVGLLPDSVHFTNLFTEDSLMTCLTRTEKILFVCLFSFLVLALSCVFFGTEVVLVAIVSTTSAAFITAASFLKKNFFLLLLKGFYKNISAFLLGKTLSLLVFFSPRMTSARMRQHKTRLTMRVRETFFHSR